MEGVRSAKARGRDRESKFYYNLEIAESVSVLPSTIRKMLEDLKKSSKGDDDFGYNSFEITAMAGTLEKSGEKWEFVARGSNQKFEVIPNDALKSRRDSGKTPVTVAGMLTDAEGKLRLEISGAKESAN